MKKRDIARVKLEKPRGILNVRAAEVSNGVSRYWPAPDLAPFVEHFWVVRWDEPFPRTAETVPHPSIHMSLDTTGRAEVVGVMDRKFTRALVGNGRVVGTKFKPGGFRPFYGAPVSRLTNRTPGIEEIFGPKAHGLGRRVLAKGDDLEGIAIIETFLRSRKPVADEVMDLVQRVTARIADDRVISRVETVAAEFDMNLRRLQRAFSEYVGVSPKWVIRRFRLMEAAVRISQGTRIDWADLALELGYSDQAHFIRDFRRFVGRTPAEYARQFIPTAAS